MPITRHRRRRWTRSPDCCTRGAFRYSTEGSRTRVMLRLGRVVPAGTITLTVYFHADTDRLAAQFEHPLLATARSQHFGKGFFDQAAELWAHDGGLLATSHQLVYFKA
ncbi:hypothetical protein [Nocardia sp. CA-119907]|uniref:hypothetical protein n=1 Tax=Nocardia sp. CA-119907 TaxID=3239973 RepID=UPI003D98D841